MPAYISVGDMAGARSIGELPRGPADIYNARNAVKKKFVQSTAGQTGVEKDADVASHDGIWMILQRAKREEDLGSDDVFIRACDIHPSIFIVLATKRQLQQITQFCTNPVEFSIFGVDPTFNIFDTNLSLTVTTYKNLRLEHKETGKPPVFIGPLLIHQRKDWQTYSNFANKLTTESIDLEGILACGTDGEKALVQGLKRNFRYAIMLRCFIHFKDNIRRELTRRGIAPGEKAGFIEEIFGKVVGDTKHCGLVDAEDRADFNNKLESLKNTWEEREAANKETTSFFEKEKV